jgi:hypothetical protein
MSGNVALILIIGFLAMGLGVYFNNIKPIVFSIVLGVFLLYFPIPSSYFPSRPVGLSSIHNECAQVAQKLICTPSPN